VTKERRKTHESIVHYGAHILELEKNKIYQSS